MYELIIFDWDDVFTSGSTDGYRACYHEAARGVGVHLSAEEERKRIDSKWGSPHRIEIEALLRDNPELVDEAVDIYEKALFGSVFVDKLSLVEGANELLDRLSKNYKLAIASGIHPKLLKERIFPTFDIPDVFSSVITSYDIDDPQMSKPHPHKLELIMSELDVEPSKTMMVGDAKNDMLMAKNANVTSVAVLTGHLSRNEAADLHVDHILDTVADLPSILEN